jgi:peptidoglycan/xylan/chitin deacetylase (PgdA/CDA1 family)
VLLLISLLFTTSVDAQVSCDFWGEHAPDITDNIAPQSEDENFLYLTLDACDGGFDKSIIAFLRANNIHATLFLSARWIKANPKALADLVTDSLFKIANHGTKHKPASVSGKSAYGIKGTSSREELIAEINENANNIESLTSVRPNWYRSGTSYYDAVSIEIITKELGLKIAGFAKNLDEGATLSADQVYRISLTAQSGDILIAHMNRPKAGTSAGLVRAIPELIKRGFIFRQLP